MVCVVMLLVNSILPPNSSKKSYQFGSKKDTVFCIITKLFKYRAQFVKSRDANLSATKKINDNENAVDTIVKDLSRVIWWENWTKINVTGKKTYLSYLPVVLQYWCCNVVLYAVCTYTTVDILVIYLYVELAATR